MRRVLALLLPWMLVGPGTVWADGYREMDNLGRVTVYEEAGDGDSTGVPVTYGFDRREFDLVFSLGTLGASDGGGEDEKAVAAVTAFMYVGQNLALGLQLGRPDLATPELLSFTPAVKAYVWRDPQSSWNRGVLFKPFSWTVSTGENDVIVGGGWTANPTLSGFVEWPLGFGALMADVGVDYVLTELSSDVPDGWGTLQANLSFVWWFIR